MPNTPTFSKTDTKYGTFHSVTGDLITQQLVQFSAPTRNELAMLASFVADGDNIIDIGAHIGIFATAFAAFNKGRGKVFSFEANPDNFRLLKKNIAENRLEAVVIPTHGVVSENNDPFKMMTPNAANTGMYYFVPDPGAGDPDLASVNIDHWHGQNEKDTPISLIKIDVEGAEMSVLRSCRGILETFKPVLYIEINTTALRRFGSRPEDIDRLLSSLGYRFFRNIGQRNSLNDRFAIGRLDRIAEGGKFFDVVAVHPESPRYPAHCAGRLETAIFKLKALSAGMVQRFTGALSRRG